MKLAVRVVVLVYSLAWFACLRVTCVFKGHAPPATGVDGNTYDNNCGRCGKALPAPARPTQRHLVRRGTVS